MGELELPGDVRVALSHAAAYGLAAILNEAGAPGVRLRWTPSLDAQAVVGAEGLEADAVASLVLDDARRHAGADSWTAATVGIAGSTVGRLSPRIKPPPDDAAWLELVRLRRETIDAEVARRAWLDLALIGALGEPAYWRFDAQGKRRPDEGASRWEMKTRNAGEDFVRNRLHLLAAAVAARDVAGVRGGLDGTAVVDEVGHDAPDSRTGTGLAGPGPIDNVRAWCALRGLCLFPVVPRMRSASETAGYGAETRGRQSRQIWFHLPVPVRPITLARLATIIASEQLAAVAAADVARDQDEGLGSQFARDWLLDRSIAVVVRLPIEVSGSVNAPERRALLGSVIRLSR